MNAADFVARLEGVRQTTPTAWVARCPAHEDRSPSLSVAEGDDGRVLLHCFAGCDVASVAAAVGVELPELFPDTEHKSVPYRLPLTSALRVLEAESSVLLVAAGRLEQGQPLAPDDVARVAQAKAKISAVSEAVYGRYS